MGEYENTSQAEWNADGIELGVVFSIKLEIANLLDKWKLEECYWRLRAFRRELDAILTRHKIKLQTEFEKEHKKETELEKKMIDDEMKVLTELRETWLANKEDEEVKLLFYNSIEEFYMQLCFIMKKHGLYFRENRDAGIAAFRR